MKYRKLPVEVEAVQYMPTGPRASVYFKDMPEWLDRAYDDDVVSNVGPSSIESWLQIKTPEGIMRCAQGDWVIRGVEGELYPCKASVFAKTYEPVSC